MIKKDSEGDTGGGRGAGFVLAHSGPLGCTQGTGILSQAFPHVASQQEPVSTATDPPDPVTCLPQSVRNFPKQGRK